MSTVEDLIQRGDRLFGKRGNLLSLWQDTADHIYVERADFTTKRSIGDDFADHLTDGFGIRARQELANAIGGMLRPPGQAWFKPQPKAFDPGDEPQQVRELMERIGARQRKFMYENAAKFTRATKEADNDYVSFGNAVITVEPVFDPFNPHLMYRAWHLRDCAWCENSFGVIDEMHRRWKPTINDLMGLFPGKLSPKLAAVDPKERYREIECRHIVMPVERYDEAKYRGRPFKFVHIYLDVENKHTIETTPTRSARFVIPRWQTVSDSQYGYSQAAVAVMPDVRMLQDMARTILEAGEKAVDPPLVATSEVVNGNIDFAAGGLTWVDAAYDERLGAAIRPLANDRSFLPITLDMQREVREQVAAAMMLNKLTLPPSENGDMTAYEVQERVREYVRAATPLFEPIEADYNGALCEETFNVLMEVGAFGRTDEWPQELQDGVGFVFENPFTAANKQEALAQFQAVGGALAQQVEYDPDAIAELDTAQMFRDAVKATGAPSDWLNTENEAAERRQGMAQQRQMQAAMQQAAMGGEAARSVGEGAQALAGEAA